MLTNIIRITDFSDPNLDVYTKLNEAQLFHYDHDKQGLFIVESPKVIERAIRAGYEPLSILLEEKNMQRDLTELKQEIQLNQTAIPNQLDELPVYALDDTLLYELKKKGYNLLRGALGAFKRNQRPDLSEFVNVINGSKNHPRIAVLENVVNPANVGAIFRSAAALGIDGVVITTDSSDPLYRRSSRASMGTVFQIPWTYIDAKTWQKVGITQLHELGYQTAAMALRKDTIAINDPKLQAVEKLAIILGSEGPGLKEVTIDKSDFTIKIPMSSGVDSLNVAAASAVAFFELGRNRQ